MSFNYMYYFVVELAEKNRPKDARGKRKTSRQSRAATSSSSRTSASTSVPSTSTSNRRPSATSSANENQPPSTSATAGIYTPRPSYRGAGSYQYTTPNQQSLDHWLPPATTAPIPASPISRNTRNFDQRRPSHSGNNNSWSTSRITTGNTSITRTNSSNVHRSNSITTLLSATTSSGSRPIATTSSSRPITTTSGAWPITTTSSTWPITTTTSNSRPITTTSNSRPITTATTNVPQNFSGVSQRATSVNSLRTRTVQNYSSNQGAITSATSSSYLARSGASATSLLTETTGSSILRRPPTAPVYTSNSYGNISTATPTVSAVSTSGVIFPPVTSPNTIPIPSAHNQYDGANVTTVRTGGVLTAPQFPTVQTPTQYQAVIAGTVYRFSLPPGCKFPIAINLGAGQYRYVNSPQSAHLADT